MAQGKKSKTNVTGREVATRDPRPKMELVVECYHKANGHLGMTRMWVPINRDPLHSA